MARPRKFSPEVQERSVRLVLEQADKHASQWAAIQSVASKIGCTAETLRRWVRQAECDQGVRTGLTSSERERLKQLERENRTRLRSWWPESTNSSSGIPGVVQPRSVRVLRASNASCLGRGRGRRFGLRCPRESAGPCERRGSFRRRRVPASCAHHTAASTRSRRRLGDTLRGWPGCRSRGRRHRAPGPRRTVVGVPRGTVPRGRRRWGCPRSRGTA